jgi:UDP-glucose 4-epimerase
MSHYLYSILSRLEYSVKILVTGGAGFIGSHIVDAYVGLGHEVTIVDDLSTGNADNLNPKAKFVELDIREPEIEKLLCDGCFDIVNHHAAQINVRKSLEDPVFDAQVNVIGSLNVISLSARHGVKRIIFASSGGAIYGEPEIFPIREDSPMLPLSPYGVAKMTTEYYLRVFKSLYKLDHVIFRYSNVYGPRQISKSEAGVISIFINQVLKGEKCFVNGDGNQVRDYVFVADVVAANVRALAAPSDFYNIGTGQATSVNGLIDILAGVIGRAVDHTHRDAIPGEVLKNLLDHAKAREKLSWLPQVNIKDGIKQTHEYFARLNARPQKIS